jgi:spore coat protein CotH
MPNCRLCPALLAAALLWSCVLDEDRDYSDWIELLNSGSTNVNLNGWSLTDDLEAPRKWRFPPMLVAPGESILVFASDKNRRIPGEELHTNFKLSADADQLALVDPSGTIVQSLGTNYAQQLPDVSFGIVAEEEEVTLISSNALARYLAVPAGGLAEVWRFSEFDDTNWAAATNGIGFDATGTGALTPAIQSEIPEAARGTPGVLVRYHFAAPNAAFAPLLLRVRYDDGFAAYLNGVLVADGNAPADPAWDATALSTREGAAPLNVEEIDLSVSAGLLHDGDNILAVHLLNVAPADPDLFLQAELAGFQRRITTNSWRYFVQPTPRAINGLGDTNLGPLILHVAHAPQLPSDADSIVVSARMERTFYAPAGLQLTYRVMFGAETTVPMLDNGASGDAAAGDGIYSASIPASAAGPGQLVRWYLRATDTAGRTTRWPPYRDTRNSPQYLGTVIADPSLTNPLPVLHWFIQSPSGADNTTGTRCSVFWKGVLYENIFANLHGQSSQGFPKKSYNFDFNPGFHLEWAPGEIPVEDINLLTTYPDKAHVRNILAYDTYKDSGHAYHFVVPVRVQRNGVFFSDAHMVEDGDADFLERVGLNPDGALYKMYNTFDSATSGVEKKTRRFEGNADLSALLSGLRSTSKNAFIYDNVNIPAMVNYLAAMIITGNIDCCHKNYYLYRDTGVTDEWQFLPWDVDLSFGRNWTTSLNYFDDTMYFQNGLYVGGNNTMPAALFANSTIKSMYLRRVRTLMDELMQAPGTPAAELKYEQKIRGLYQQISPDAALDYAKWTSWGTRQTMAQALGILTNEYFPKRRNYLFNTLGNTIPKPVTNQIVVRFGALDFNPASGTQTQEYFTVTNGTPAYLDISGWTVEGAVEHTFAPGTVLPPNTAIYLSPDVRAFRKRTVGPRGGQSLFAQGNYQGQLSARGETLGLRDKNQMLLATRTYAGEPTAAQRSLRIVELLFAPAASPIPGILAEDLEYLVLQNTGAQTLQLQGVHFTNGITYTFTNSALLEPSQRLYLAKNPEAFVQFYGTNVMVFGPYFGQLANGGESIQIHDAVGENVLEFDYDRAWYPVTQAGASLVLSDPQTPFDKFGEKSSWSPSAYAGGSAGITQAWTTWRAQEFTAEQLALPASGPSADLDLDGASNYAEFVAGTSPSNPNSHFRVQATVSSPAQVHFTATAGREYIIDAANNPGGPWQSISVLPRAQQSGAVQMPVEANPGATTARFYRVRVNL